MSARDVQLTGSAAVQSHLWGRAARDWAGIQEGQARPLYESVLETLDVGDGTTLLDVGCGAGMFCLLAANRGAEVCGFDASAELLEIARGRAPAGDFRQGDAECLPYPNGIFDLVTGFDSFRYTAVPTSALREARRVSKSGAPVVVAVWGDESDCEASAIFDALAALATTRPETFAPAA